MDVGFLQETKLTQGIHTSRSVGYKFWVTEAYSQHRGGVTVVQRAAKGWQVKGAASFGPNVMSFLLMSGARLWYIVGSYVPPNNVPDVHRVEHGVIALPKLVYMILMEDLNAQLGDPCDEHEEDLETALVDRGMVNMTDPFMT